MSVMAVVPEDYCLTKPRLKGSVVTAENVGRLNDVPVPVWLPVPKYTVQRAMQESHKNTSAPFVLRYLTYFKVTGLYFSK